MLLSRCHLTLLVLPSSLTHTGTGTRKPGFQLVFPWHLAAVFENCLGCKSNILSHAHSLRPSLTIFILQYGSLTVIILLILHRKKSGQQDYDHWPSGSVFLLSATDQSAFFYCIYHILQIDASFAPSRAVWSLQIQQLLQFH